MSLLFLSFPAQVSECLFKLAADTSAKMGQEHTNLVLLNEKKHKKAEFQTGMDNLSSVRHEIGCLIQAFSSSPPTITKFLFFQSCFMQLLKMNGGLCECLTVYEAFAQWLSAIRFVFSHSSEAFYSLNANEAFVWRQMFSVGYSWGQRNKQRSMLSSFAVSLC